MSEIEKSQRGLVVSESGVEPVGGLHDKRRVRMRARFTEQGDLQGFQDHEVLEMLLYNCIPRKDTNVIAHRLINKFSNISNVLAADISELKSIEGMSEVAAVSLHFHKQVGDYIIADKAVRRNSILTLQDAAIYAHTQIGGFATEHLLALCLDSGQRILRKETVERGSPDTVGYFTRTVIKRCLNSSTISVIFAHNHPSGLNLPSYEDALMTENLVVALAHSGIELADHLIITESPKRYYSFRQAGHLHGYLEKHGLRKNITTLAEGRAFLYENEMVQGKVVKPVVRDSSKPIACGNAVSSLVLKARGEWDEGNK